MPLEADELESLLPNDDKAIEVDCFVPSNHIDAVHYSGRTYYLVPDDPPGQRPFCVLRDGLRLTDRHAVARVVMSRRQQLVLLRPLGKLVAMTVLEYPQRVRPVENYEGEVAPLSANAAEQELIRQLIDSMTIADLELSQYRDPYVERLSRLIERRLASTEPVDSAPSRAVADDDAALVAALRASLASDANGRSAAAPIGLNRMPLRSGDTEGGLARKLG